MSEVSAMFDKIVKDLQKGCKDVDEFNKVVFKNIDKTNHEVLEFIATLLKLPHQPNDDPTKDDKNNQRNGGGIWNPFDD